MITLEKIQLNNNTIFATHENFIVKIHDAYHQYGYVFEIFDLSNFINTKYNFTVDCGVLLLNPHKSFYERPDKISSKEDKLLQTKTFCEIVPVENDFVKMYYNTVDFNLNKIENMVKNKNAIFLNAPKTSLNKYYENDNFKKIIYFDSEASAKIYIEALLSVSEQVSFNIENILDRKINLDGTDGWSILYNQLTGVKNLQNYSKMIH